MSVEVLNLSQLQHKLRRLPDSVTDAAVDVIQDTGIRIRDKAKARTRDGEVRDTIRKRSSNRGLNATIKPAHWRAKFEHFGTKAHTIEPKHKDVMASPEFGPVSRAVRHPGQDANPFLFTAAEEERQTFHERLAASINAEMKRVAR